MKDGLNDNDRARAPGAQPDAHGQAALLLVESLLHGLIARGVIGVRDAIDIVDTAAEVKAELAVDMGDNEQTMHRSLAILSAIGHSLTVDLDGDGRA